MRSSSPIEADLAETPDTTEIAPVFIAGCGRSGTTYLRTIIAAHPDVFIPSESLFIADYLRFGHLLPRRLLTWLFHHEPQLRSWYTGPIECVDDVARAVRTCHQRQAKSIGARIWGQKTPRFVRYMPEFEEAFPRCRWILVYRDPRAVVASHLKSPRHTYSTVAAARRWVRDNEPIVRLLGPSQQPSHIMLVKYEDLVRDFDAHLLRLFEFVGVTSMHRAEVVERGRAWEYRGTGFSVEKNNLRDGLEPQLKSIDSWKGQLSEGQVRTIESICGPTMSALGYDPLPPGDPSLRPRKLESVRRAGERLKDAGIVYQYMTAWPTYPLYTLLRKSVIGAFAKARRKGVM